MRHWLQAISLCLCFPAAAQKLPATAPRQNVYGISFHNGKVMAHNNTVQNVRQAKSWGISFDLSKQLTDSVSYSFCRAYVRKGFSFSFFDLGTPILGTGFISSYFLEPVYRIGNKLQFQFRGEAGAGYFSNPYDSIKNPTNNNYSQHITPYLTVSAGFGFRITHNLSLEGNASLHHMSNGNYREPNAGLNWGTFSATFLYYPGYNLFPRYNKPPRYKWSEKKAGLDLGLMYVPKQGYHRKWNNTRNFMIGLFVTGSKKISRMSAVTAGAEISCNKFVDAPTAAAGNSKPGVVGSLQVGHEFLLNKIIFSQQAGIYITHYPSFYKCIYHRWGLRYRVNSRLYAGFNMKAHKYTADFIDLRIQYKLF
ncbi:MAG: acyloxyacyl hydrolase [Chitinophagaceae bacterium]